MDPSTVENLVADKRSRASAGTRAAHRVTEGDVIGDKYRVERVIGAGGMGVVVAARVIADGRRVALKLLLAGALEDTEAALRFAREGRALSRLRTPHVARLLDKGTLASGAPFLVMEYLEGRDLATLLRERGRLPVDLAVDYALQAANGLAEAHAKGIIHRDLKPGNLFIARAEGGAKTLKVLDFGISKVTSMASHEDKRLTTATELLGSPLYMSPEQLRSTRDVDERTDVWSLGVVLYELLTGRPPFDGDTLVHVGAKILHARPTSPKFLRAEVSRALADIVLKCLEKDPSARHESIADLAAALAACAEGRSAAPVLAASPTEAPKSVARRPMALANAPALAVAMGVAVVGIASLVTSVRSAENRAPPVPRGEVGVLTAVAAEVLPPPRVLAPPPEPAPAPDAEPEPTGAPSVATAPRAKPRPLQPRRAPQRPVEPSDEPDLGY
jgi:eukaryotic-like serine/threonine-protein kinase